LVQLSRDHRATRALHRVTAFMARANLQFQKLSHHVAIKAA
jgi:hypothetical protein